MYFLQQGTMSFSILKWVGTATGVTGAFVLALNLPLSGWGWVLFGVSSLCWTIAGIAMRDYSLVVLQSAFFIVDILGIWRWLVL